MTTKLLMIGDAGAPTGFEKVLRNVCEYLHTTSKYDITIRGIGYEPEHSKLSYPCEVKAMGGTHHDPVGLLNFDKWIEEDKPDVVWAVQDLWNIVGLGLGKPPELPMVAYFPVDTPNMSFGNAWGVGAITEAVAYTNFGARECAAGVQMAIDFLVKRKPEVSNEPLQWVESQRIGKPFYGRMDRYARYQNPRGFNIVPHGLDQSAYAPRDKAAARKAMKLPAKGFLISYVSTNQFRKRQDLAIRGFARHLLEHPDSWLVLHCAHDNGQAWDLAQLAHLYGIRDRIILTHQTLGELSEDDLCTLYNTADANINTSGGEGWGLVSFESAACGVPQIVPDWSATRELWKGHAMLTKVSDYRIEPRMGINTAHATIDVKHLAQQLAEMAKPAVAEEYSKKSLAYIATQPGWPVVGEAFDQIIQNAMQEPAPRDYSLAQLQQLRTAPVECEVANWL